MEGFRRHSVARFVSALLLAVVLLMFGLVTPAAAEPAGDRIEELGLEIEVLAEDYNAANIRYAEIKRKLTAAEARVNAAKAELVTRQVEVRQLAINAYTAGGGSNALAAVLASDGTDIGQRQGYASATSGGRQQRIDQLRAIQDDVAGELTQLRAVERQAEQVRTRIADRRRAAEAAVAEQQRLQRQVRARQARPATPKVEAAPPVAVPAPNDGAAAAIETARQQLGKPYQWGADGPNSFDCSGLTMYAWQAGGVSLPHNSRMQYSATRRISRAQLQPGDLVFYGDPIHHVALYIGGGQIIQAPHSGANVRQVSMDYSSQLVGFGRVG